MTRIRSSSGSHLTHSHQGPTQLLVGITLRMYFCERLSLWISDNQQYIYIYIYIYIYGKVHHTYMKHSYKYIATNHQVLLACVQIEIADGT